MYHDWVYPKPALVVFSVSVQSNPAFSQSVFVSILHHWGVGGSLLIIPLSLGEVLCSALLTPGVDHGREGMKGKGKGRMDGIYVFYGSLLLLYYTRQVFELEE